jgi:ABC-2 type transport system permease protein
VKKVLIMFLCTLRRSKALALTAFLCSVALCFFFNMLIKMSDSYYDGIPIGLYDADNSVLSADFRTYLSEELGMRVLLSGSYDELKTELVERHIAGIAEVPEGFEELLLAGNAAPLLITFLDDYANSVFVKSYLDGYMRSVSLLASASQGDGTRFHSMLSGTRDNSVGLSVTSADLESRRYETVHEGFVRTLGFFFMVSFLLAFGISNMLSDDRESGTVQRIQVSSATAAQYILGLCLVGLLISVILASVVLCYMYLSAPLISIPFLSAALICLAFSLVVVGLALVCGLYLKSKNAILAAIIGISTIFSLLGGSYFPIDSSPELLQRLARVTPQFWAIDALSGLRFDADYNWGFNLAILCLFALLLFILSGIRFASNRSSAQL